MRFLIWQKKLLKIVKLKTRHYLKTFQLFDDKRITALACLHNCMYYTQQQIQIGFHSFPLLIHLKYEHYQQRIKGSKINLFEIHRDSQEQCSRVQCTSHTGHCTKLLQWIFIMYRSPTTVFIRIVATATINFSLAGVRLLIKGGFY